MFTSLLGSWSFECVFSPCLDITLNFISIQILKLLKNKNNELWLPLLFHSFILIFVTVVLAFTDKKSFSETIPFILFVSIFYIFTLVWLCGVRINQKKKNIDVENQKMYNDWK